VDKMAATSDVNSSIDERRLLSGTRMFVDKKGEPLRRLKKYLRRSSLFLKNNRYGSLKEGVLELNEFLNSFN
jgi:hypothetical protein